MSSSKCSPRSVTSNLGRRVETTFQVSSVDSGHSLTGQPLWDSAGLAGTAAPTGLTAASGISVESSVLASIREKLADVTDTGIAGCVGALPTEWGVDADDKVAICQFIRRRVDAVISLLPTAGGSTKP